MQERPGPVGPGTSPGDYSLHAAAIVGESGRVYALDKSRELISGLRQRASAQGRGNITAIVADITAGLPMHMRLSADEVTAWLSRRGFRRTDLVDLGYNYMALFKTA